MRGGKNCYPDSDILINKYNIQDKEVLEKFEIQKVFVKLLGLDVKPNRIPYTYDVKHLVNIQKYLFGDIYEWAGTFREGNTRTCITFIWHYLKGKGVDFQVALLRNNPMYVRDSLVMANYDQKEYLERIISGALQKEIQESEYLMTEKESGEQYKIAKSDYEAFRNKYSIKKGN